MGTISIHATITIGDSPVTEQEGDLVCGLWPEAKEIPEHVSVLCRMEHRNDHRKFTVINNILYIAQ